MFKVRLNSGQFVHNAPLHCGHDKKTFNQKVNGMRKKQCIVENYKGFIEEWKVALILSILKKRGFDKSQWEDIVQDIILDVKNFQWTPTSDATEKTVLTTAIHHWVTDIIRAQSRKRKIIQSYQDLRECNQDADNSQMRLFEFALDVHNAINDLKSVDQKICMLLMEGKTCQQIARQLRWTWYRLGVATNRILQHFKKLGLNQYAGGYWNE